MSFTVHSLIRSVSIEMFKNNYSGIIRCCFSEMEKSELVNRPFQTKAGFYAVKKALMDICLSLHNTDEICEGMFIISHKDNGAPFVKEVSAAVRDKTGLNSKDFYISVSHNKKNAYGMASVQEETA